ncbi:MAG: ABC transporter substrate-binding protein [Candidatus Methanomethylicaceae archaeon]
MAKTLVLSVLGIICLVPSFLFAQVSEPIVIGAPIPRASTYGQNGERSLILAMEEINAAGGIDLGGVKRPIRLEIVDTRDEEPGVPTSEVLLAIEKLILDKKVKFLVGGPCMSECCLAALELPPKYKVIQVISIGCWTPGWIAKTGKDIERYKYSFRLSGHVGYWIENIVEFLNMIKERYGFEKIYISAAEAAHCKAAAAAVEKGAVAGGWKVVGKEVHPLATSDFSMLLRDVKRAGAHVLFVWDHTPEALALVNQWHDMKLPAALIGFIGPTEDAVMWQQTKGKVAYMVEFAGEGGTLPGQRITPLTPKFFDGFLRKWKEEPRGTGNVPSYTALYLLKNAIERARTLDVDSLVPVIEQTDMITVGGRLRFEKSNHQAVYAKDPKEGLMPQLLQWQDGKRVCIWPPKIATGEFKLPPWVKPVK